MFIAKAKAFLLHLYPELARFSLFNQVSSLAIPTLTPKVRKLMRYGLPIIIVSFSLLVGVGLGNFLLFLFTPSVNTPTPIVIVTPTPTNAYKSTLLPLSRSVGDFNPQLPDPLPPVFDEKISLEPLPQ